MTTSLRSSLKRRALLQNPPEGLAQGGGSRGVELEVLVQGPPMPEYGGNRGVVCPAFVQVLRRLQPARKSGGRNVDSRRSVQCLAEGVSRHAGEIDGAVHGPGHVHKNVRRSVKASPRGSPPEDFWLSGIELVKGMCIQPS